MSTGCLEKKMNSLEKKMNSDMISILNNPERLLRVDKFKVKAIIKQVNSQNVVALECSEAIVAPYNVFLSATNLIEKEMAKTDKPSLYNINKAITEYFRFLLLYCRANFEEEVHHDLFVNDQQILRVDKEGLVIHEVMNG